MFVRKSQANGRIFVVKRKLANERETGERMRQTDREKESKRTKSTKSECYTET